MHSYTSLSDLITTVQQQYSTREIGLRAESNVATYLSSHGYRVLDRNVKLGRDEIDLVAWDREMQEVVFVEVKWRETSWYGHPASAVDRAKMRRLERAAVQYIQRFQRQVTYRFDIIAISAEDGLDHFENVSWEY